MWRVQPVPSRVVVLQPAFLGDVVFASPLTRAMAEGWPGCELVFVARPPADEIARQLPGVTRVVVYDKRGKDAGWAGLRRVGAELRRFAPEVVVSLHDSPRTAVLAWLSGAPRRLGPSGGLGDPLYTHSEGLEELGYAARSCALAEALGLSARPELELRLSLLQRERGRAAVPEGTVALIPGSEWETKRWPVERAAELVKALRIGGTPVVLLGSPAEKPLCAELNSRVGGSCLDLSGNRVAESIEILSACRAVVGGDSGLVHAARALGVPTVALFGPTPVWVHLPAAGDRFVSLGLACSPCSDHGGRRCPLGHHRCLRDLGADRVARALEEVG